MANDSVENQALEALDIEYVLDIEGMDYKVTWGRSGRQLNLRFCPFCGNRKWKVYLNADSGLGNCFAGSCTQGTFNKWQILRAIYDLSAPDMRRKIAALAVAQGWRPRRAVVRVDPGPLSLPPNVPVADLPALPKYLLDRGLDRDLAANFDLRWCESGTFSVTDPTGKCLTQDYSNRIIIPIYTFGGDLISFQGRDATGKSTRKYLFPPMYASTGSHLYNLNNWSPHMDTVVIGEGVFDVIGLQRGLDYAEMTNVLPVGSFGMHLSNNPGGDDQVSKLLGFKPQLKRIIMCWDNEPAALRNAVETATSLLRYGFEVSVAKLEGVKDPGEATPEVIAHALKNSYPVRNALQAMMLSKKLCP